MTHGQIANGIGSAFTAICGLVFILSYSLLARWYRSIDGRMMMVLGTGITFTCVLTVSMTLHDFTKSIDYLRFIQAGLIVTVGFTLLFYSIRVWRLQYKRRKRGNDE